MASIAVLPLQSAPAECCKVQRTPESAEFEDAGNDFRHLYGRYVIFIFLCHKFLLHIKIITADGIWTRVPRLLRLDALPLSLGSNPIDRIHSIFSLRYALVWQDSKLLTLCWWPPQWRNNARSDSSGRWRVRFPPWDTLEFYYIWISRPPVWSGGLASAALPSYQ